MTYIPFAIMGMISIASAAAAEGTATVRTEAFGKTDKGTPVSLYVLKNKNGMEAAVTNFGAILVYLKTPDRNGKMADVVLGFDTLEGYEQKNPYFGATIGRYGNRIAKGRFTLDDKQYTLFVNDGENTLHGGDKGFNTVVWTGKATKVHGEPSVELHYLRRDR